MLLLFHAGCCIVTKFPLMLCTGEYRSVNELIASNSTRFWLATLFRYPRALLENRSPVPLAVKSDRFTWVRARVAGTPLTYSCRVSMSVPTAARQMFLPESASDQPVTCRAPVMIGGADAAACQITV